MKGGRRLTTAEEMIVVLAGCADDYVVLGRAFGDGKVGAGD